jgi:hypothetical protein
MPKGFENFDPQELVEISKKGGIRSGEVRREKRDRRKSIREIVDILLAMPLKNGELADFESIGSFKEAEKSNLTAKEALMVKTVAEALAGNRNALDLILDIIEERPDAQAQTVNINHANANCPVSSQILQALLEDNTERNPN